MAYIFHYFEHAIKCQRLGLREERVLRLGLREERVLRLGLREERVLRLGLREEEPLAFIKESGKTS